MSDLEDRIAGGKIAPVYLLVGSDPLLYQRVLGALTAAIVTPATRSFNLDAFEGKSTTAQAVLNAARTLPMMAKRRLVVVRDVDGLGAEGLAQLAAYLEAPAPETTLVLSTPKADARLKFIQVA
jgi:DNA polymerase-3 subunit delta